MQESKKYTRAIVQEPEKVAVAMINHLPASSNAPVKQIIVNVAGKRKFKYTDYLVRLSYCESRFDVTRTNDNGEFGIDRGPFQINNFFHPEVNDKQARDVIFATNWTIDMINAGRQHEWACDKLIKGKLNYIAMNK
ncbi:MAG: hypothetical protein PHO56_02125 [Patescibacteria group bacterium]|nr:hypothetical protein [Patescibacteria group bacterium]